MLLTNRLLAQLGEFAGLVVYFGLQIAKLSAQIAAQAIQITAKDGEIRVLRDELTALKARMSKDSHNSSKPPSTDGLHKKPRHYAVPHQGQRVGKKDTRAVRWNGFKSRHEWLYARYRKFAIIVEKQCSMYRRGLLKKAGN